MKHLLGLAELSSEQILDILQLAEYFHRVTEIEKIKNTLTNKVVVNLFFENSTRTRSSFEIAAKRLGAEVINIPVASSSAKKGESLLDTVNNLFSMNIDLLIIRSPRSGAAEFLAKSIQFDASIINAGDGCHEHPTQGLLDIFTIRYYKKNFPNIKVAIVGDILHSRVARSLIFGLKNLGVSEITVVGPRTLIPKNTASLGVNLSYCLEEGIQDADVIVSLRLQKERMAGVYLPNEREYSTLYGLTETKLHCAKKDVIIMHPGPLNREIEISSEVADGPRSVILSQVSFGVAIRMAAMTSLLNPKETR